MDRYDLLKVLSLPALPEILQKTNKKAIKFRTLTKHFLETRNNSVFFFDTDINPLHSSPQKFKQGGMNNEINHIRAYFIIFSTRGERRYLNF